MAEIAGAYTQVAFRGHKDDGNETTATWAANQNTNWTQLVDTNFRPRFLIEETGGGNDLLGFKLQYNLAAAGWNDVNASSSVVRSSASANFADLADTTSQLTGGTGTFLADNDGMDEVDGAQPYKGSWASKKWEVEFCVQIRSADVTDAQTLQLRVIKDNSVALDVYTATPTVTVSEPAIPVYDQDSYRFRNDDGTEATATWKAAVNTVITQHATVPFRLRVLIQCTVAGEAGFTPVMQYRIDTGAGYGAWGAVPTTATEAAHISTSVNVTNGADTTKQLGAGSFTTNNNGIRNDPVEPGNTLTTVVNEEWEAEWVMALGGSPISNGDTIQFRMTNSGVALDTYTNTPELTVTGAGPPAANTPGGMMMGVHRT